MNIHKVLWLRNFLKRVQRTELNLRDFCIFTYISIEKSLSKWIMEENPQNKISIFQGLIVKSIFCQTLGVWLVGVLSTGCWPFYKCLLNFRMGFDLKSKLAIKILNLVELKILAILLNLPNFPEILKFLRWISIFSWFFEIFLKIFESRDFFPHSEIARNSEKIFDFSISFLPFTIYKFIN